MENLNKAVKVLQSGKIIIHNTDTCIGMAVNICDRKAVEFLYYVKKMESLKPVSILCSDIKMACEYGVFSKKALELAKQYLPGGLTFIVPRSDKLPLWINPKLDSIGIRIPNHKFSIDMVKELGCPVTTTSCNISGRVVCENQDEVLDLFSSYIENGDMYVFLNSKSSKLVSTIIKVEGDKIVVVREGVIKLL